MKERLIVVELVFLNFRAGSQNKKEEGKNMGRHKKIGRLTAL
ncbi:hypothetical protein [Aggregatibacter actinomycetemcomitans]|nr:hypothetical protein [Aggregatibacter actinomycetemcomitans]